MGTMTAIGLPPSGPGASRPAPQLDRPGPDDAVPGAVEAGAPLRQAIAQSVTKGSPRRSGRWLLAGALVTAFGAAGAVWFARGPGDPDRLWVKAELAFRAGRWGEARAMLHQIERLRTKTARDWILQGQLASAAGHDDDALAALCHVPEADPLAAQAFLLAGRIERQRKRLRGAEAQFKRALEANPSLIEAHKELIYIYGIQRRRREVDSEFNLLSRLTQLNHQDLFTWSLTHFSEWSPDVASDLSEFVAADPGDRYSRLALAEVLADEPGPDATIDKVLAGLAASDPDALAARARYAITNGRLAEAEAMLARGPAGHPGLDRLRGKLAMLRHDIDAAVAFYRKALSFEPYDRVSMFDLGQALRLKGERNEAEALLDRTRRLNEVYELVIRVRAPDRENQLPDLTHFARACEAAGLTQEARRWYALAVSRDPLDSEAQHGLHRLGSPKPGS
jgi:tetratricopeptide (TPR) repeat protein